MSEFHKLLTEHRKQAGISKSELARRTDVTASYVSRLESGEREPSRELVVKFANALNLEIDDRNKLLISSQYAPIDLADVMSEKPIYKSLANVLDNSNIPDDEKRDFEEVIMRQIQLIQKRYKNLKQ